MSIQQTVATVTVFDYELDAQGAPVVGATIIVTLNQQPASAIAPVVNLKPTRVQVTTDANGYWSLPLIPNTNINPANTVYNVSTPMYGTYQISVPAGAGPFQASAISTSPAISLPPAGPFTSGSVLFANTTGGAAQDNGNLFWNSTFHRLGVGTVAPSYPVHIRGSQNGAVLGLDSVTSGNQTTLRFLDAGNPLWDIYKFGIGSQLTFYDVTNGRQVLSLFPETAIGTMQIRDGWHIVINGPSPTLGALQAGVSSQSIAGSDAHGALSVTTTGAPPGAGATIAIPGFSTAYGTGPAIFFTNTSGNQGIGGFASTANFTVFTQAALAAGTTYNIYYWTIG